jgi:hypothetical protein
MVLAALFHGYVQTGDRVSTVYLIFLFLFLKKKKEIYREIVFRPWILWIPWHALMA